MQTDIERTTGEPGQPCTIEQDIAELIVRDFSLSARLRRARQQHRARRHLLRYQRLSKAAEMMAA